MYFFLLLFVLTTILVVGIRFDPNRRYAEPTHAARVKSISSFIRTHRYANVPKVIEDVYGNMISTKDKFVGSVYGNSCKRFGLRDGSIYLADPLDDTSRLAVAADDLVVITAPAKNNAYSKRIRKVKSIDDSKIEFYSDASDCPHRIRNRSNIYAKITHVLM